MPFSIGQEGGGVVSIIYYIVYHIQSGKGEGLYRSASFQEDGIWFYPSSTRVHDNICTCTV